MFLFVCLNIKIFTSKPSLPIKQVKTPVPASPSTQHTNKLLSQYIFSRTDWHWFSTCSRIWQDNFIQEVTRINSKDFYIPRFNFIHIHLVYRLKHYSPKLSSKQCRFSHIIYIIEGTKKQNSQNYNEILFVALWFRIFIFPSNI